MSRVQWIAAVVLALAFGSAAFAQGDPSQVFGPLRLIDEVVAGQEQQHGFAESKPGISQVRDILGKPTRVIPNTSESAKFVMMRLGKGANLQANRQYVLQVDYPEDAPRTMFIHNRGAETSRGLHTGNTVGDALHPRYVDSNVESLKYPLSQKHESFQMLFVLQDRYHEARITRGNERPRSLTPADGVPVLISQWGTRNGPASQGAAYSRIALYEVTDPSKLTLPINYPPEGLPRRHLFWREEMSDGVVGKDNPGWNNDVDWFEAKAKLMLFLGMNTFSTDMLEFGHNQGWDSSPHGHEWLNASHAPQRWENVLKMLKAGNYPFTILPYYEYAGSVGPKSVGTRKLARPLGDTEAYTHITWSEKAYADVSEPETLEDAKKVLDLTIVRWKDIMPFTGAWLRTRPSHMPVSFSDNALAKFAKEANNGQAITRDELRQRGELYQRYLSWWNDERKEFLIALRDHLRSQGIKDAMIMFTADASEPGIGLRVPGRAVVTDDVEGWRTIAPETKPIDINEVIAKDLYLEALMSPHPTWDKWEWDHSLPRADPKNYVDTDGILMTYSFNRIYTVASQKAFDAFRTVSGIAAMRHYTLNENEMPDEDLGYFVMDVDRTRAHMMRSEVMAVANGDPWYIGYFAGHQFNRGFPYYARRFNQAYLSLPALPSKIVADGASDKEVVVRAIETPQNGTWLAVANTSMEAKPKVTIKLPEGANVTDAATGAKLTAADGQLVLDMDASELRAIHVTK